MESCAMSEQKFDLNVWGIRIASQGVVGIAAAVVVVTMLLLAWRY
jgi:hypothetical protein